MENIERLVPCNGCTACCRREIIRLRPNAGDNPANYQTVEVVENGVRFLALAHKANGDCIYLEGNRCSIWQNRPVVCRSFDCRRLFETLSRKQRRAGLASGKFSAAILAAGRARFKVL